MSEQTERGQGERERLTAILEEAINSPHWFTSDIADAILAAGYRSPTPSADAAQMREALTDAIAIIRKYVPSDALGSNSEGGGDGWNDRSWPILDEHLHYMEEALKGVANPPALPLPVAAPSADETAVASEAVIVAARGIQPISGDIVPGGQTRWHVPDDQLRPLLEALEALRAALANARAK